MLQILGNPPFFTFVVFVLCIILYLFQPSIPATCLLPQLIVSSFQLYRVMLYPFIHTSFFHILLNMLAWMTLGRDFEHTIGTLPAIYTIIILLIPFITVVHIMSSYLLDSIFSTKFRYDCLSGLSGVLFAILVTNLQLSGNRHASFFGLFSVPIVLFPFLIAGLVQLFAPGASLLGHLCGIAGGNALAHGWMRVVTPSDDRFDAIESGLNLVSLPAWQPVPAMFGHLLDNVADHLLPGAPGVTPPPTLRQRAQGVWRRVSNWFSSSNNYDAGESVSELFVGAGHPLGGGTSQEHPRGRVPPNSRLLLLDEQRSTSTDENIDDTSSNTSHSQSQPISSSTKPQ